LASPRTLLSSGASRRTRALLVTGLAAAATFGVLPAGISSADPTPTLREVEQRVTALNDKVELANEQYSDSRLGLAAANRRAGVALARVTAAEAQLNVIKKSMGAIAAAAYRSGGTDQFVQLVSTSTPQTFLDRASSLDRIAAGQSAQLAAAATARHRLDSARAAARSEQNAAMTVSKQMSSAKATIESALSEQQRLLSGLKADERRRLETERAAAAATARASRSRVTTDNSTPTDTSTPTYNGPASGGAAVAVREAYNQLGKPYHWGSAGPDSFDCSGLTMWAWGHAGVSLSHSSRAQFNEGRHVSQSDLQPGDLTFYGSPIHHVGVYIGKGQMISAPKTGDVVHIQNAFRSDYVGGVRP
jgi:cell wall-associated NlpC family hydrolase